MIIATHDRYFLDNITKWILELDGGRGIPFEGNYSSWLEQKLELLAQQEKKKSARRQLLERELQWIRMNTAEHRELSRARIAEFERLVAAETRRQTTTPLIQIAPADHLGDQVIEVHGRAARATATSRCIERRGLHRAQGRGRGHHRAQRERARRRSSA